MATATPTCPRCRGRAIYIGIGPGAEPACARDCAGKCPRCLSPDVEPFRTSNYWTGVRTEGTHCVPCGHVWDVRRAP